MKFVIQRVKKAEVMVEQQVIGQISRGFLVLVGISDTDTREIADKMIKKMLHLRIFADSAGKTNLCLKDIDGNLLIISQFTLYADCRKGNRPSFTKAGHSDIARQMYEYIIEKCRETFPDTQQGCFGAEMEVSLVNQGPFTIILDSDML